MLGQSTLFTFAGQYSLPPPPSSLSTRFLLVNGQLECLFPSFSDGNLFVGTPVSMTAYRFSTFLIIQVDVRLSLPSGGLVPGELFDVLFGP